jgi:threonine dehydrogenase-like Zn-dependent dehydrogenase
MGAEKIIGIDIAAKRLDLAKSLGLCDHVLTAGPDNVDQVRALTGGLGVERAVDCSASAEARATAIRATRKWGRMAMVGEGGTVSFNPSPDIIHDQKTIYGSWVTSIWLMEELVERLIRWNLHPQDLVTHRFALEQADEAYKLMASGRCGKVAVCPAGE